MIMVWRKQVFFTQDNREEKYSVLVNDSRSKESTSQPETTGDKARLSIVGEESNYFITQVYLKRLGDGRHVRASRRSRMEDGQVENFRLRNPYMQ